MSRPEDARALRSRDALQVALLALIDERPFENISIRDITNRAGVSYPVFFRRYATKEQLLDDIATGEIRQLLSLTSPIFEADKQTESLKALCAHIDEQRVLWTRLLTGGAASAMRGEFRRIAKEIGDTREQANPWLPRDLAASFVVAGLFEILAWWLRQPVDYPMENVIKIIDALIVRATVQPRDVQLL
jgi:AcrR family transcriptional regulator